MRKAIFAIATLAMTLCFTLTSCKEKDEDAEGRPYYTKFVDINIIRCERVGGVLMIDFKLANKQDRTLNGYLFDQTVVDNSGKEYDSVTQGSGWWGHTAIAFAENDYFEYADFRIAAKDTIEGHLKVYEYDPNDKTNKVSVKIGVKINDEELADKRYESGNIAVVDNRIKTGGIQTNDTKMAYQVTSCAFNEDFLEIHFTITNNTGRRIGFGMGDSVDPYEAYDNLGNNYRRDAWNPAFKLADNDWMNAPSTTIAADGSVDCILRIPDVRENATDISATIYVGSEYYIFEDDVLRLLSIPIEK